MADNGPKPDELICPLWGKTCSEVNPGKSVCKKFMIIQGMLPGDIAPHGIPVCQDEFILGMVQKILQVMVGGLGPKSRQGAISIDDILRKG